MSWTSVGNDTNQVYWWWPGSGDTTNTNAIAYNTLRQAWLPIVGLPGEIAETVYASGVQYLLVSDTTGRILRVESGTTFDGTAISRIFTLPWLSGGPPHPELSWRRLRVSYGNQTSGTVTISARTAQHPEEFAAATFTTVDTLT